MLIDDELLSAIDEKITVLGLEYAQVQGLILTEDDLKCKLYSELIKIPFLAKPEVTKDRGIKGSRVHAEASWFDLFGKLGIKPDLTIFDPQNLSIIHSLQSQFKFPSKGYHALGNAIIFELKFIWGRNGITKSNLATIRKDVDKIKELYQKMEEDDSPYSLISYIVFFSKVASKHDDLIASFQAEMANDNRFRVFYRTGAIYLHSS